jgi:capsular polysaccharide export protein
MFFDKPVVACGQCFWAMPGVADTAPDPAAIRSLFAHPEGLGVDMSARAAFLSYLLEEYYVGADGGPNEGRKILTRLVKG